MLLEKKRSPISAKYIRWAADVYCQQLSFPFLFNLHRVVTTQITLNSDWDVHG